MSSFVLPNQYYLLIGSLFSYIISPIIKACFCFRLLLTNLNNSLMTDQPSVIEYPLNLSRL